MKLLGIDTATEMLSLAVEVDGRMYEQSMHAGQRHSEIALAEIGALLARAGVGLADLDGIAYGAGPGSFTGLRIACGIVQGLAAARRLPVFGIGTLAAIAGAAGEDRVIACIDARMSEVYHAAYERRGAGLTEVLPPSVTPPHDAPLPPGAGWVGCGPGFAVYPEALRARYGGRIVRFRPEVFPTAAAIVRLALPRFAAGAGEDAAAAVPIYLRDRVALKTAE